MNGAFSYNQNFDFVLLNAETISDSLSIQSEMKYATSKLKLPFACTNAL